MIEQCEQHSRRSHTKRDTISQRVKFHSQFAADTKGTSHFPVKEIEEGSQKNKKKSNLITMIECRIRGDTSTNEIATGDDIGYMLFHL